MFKVFQKVLGLIVVLLLLILVIGHPLRGGKLLGPIGDLIIAIAETPQSLKALDQGTIHAIALTEEQSELWAPDREELNMLDGYKMLYYSWPDRVVLYDFEKGQEEKVYKVPFDQLLSEARAIQADLLKNKGRIGYDLSKNLRLNRMSANVGSSVLDGDDLIFHSGVISYLYKVDDKGDVKWVNKEGFFHHSIEIMDSLIYVCGVDTSSWYGSEYALRDDAIWVVNKNTGKTVDKWSVCEIFDRNGILSKILGSMAYDPIHLNDVQPASYTTAYWEKGDIGLSSRHLNLACIYRPSNDSIIWLEQTETLGQHDFDFVGESTIRLFDNNTPNFRNEEDPPLHGKDHYSQIVEFDLESGTRKEFGKGIFSTLTQGRVQGYDGFWLIEETDKGFYYVLDTATNEALKFYMHFNDDSRRAAQYPCWSRLYRTTENGLTEN